MALLTLSVLISCKYASIRI